MTDPLIKVIQEMIQETGNITFAQYMQLALYHPEYGYYTSQRVKIGTRGDFFTSVSLGADFGELLAEKLWQCWQNLDSPSSFTIVEMGAGSGELAIDLLNYLERVHKDFYQTIDYRLIEISAQLRLQQQEYIQANLTAPIPINWQWWTDITPDSIVGCFFSNELVDAFPVHQVIVKEGKLLEVYVTDNQGELSETIGDISTPRLTEYFELVEINIATYPDNYRTEVNLQALDWLETISTKLNQGYLITLDYGYLASRYYHPQRSQGTLQCYWKQGRHNNPYLHIGKQDITASVDFTALQRFGDKHGLESVELTQQALFLMSLGLGDRLAGLSTGSLSLPELFKRRDALHQLIDPVGLGGFQVLIQSKGIT